MKKLALFPFLILIYSSNLFAQKKEIDNTNLEKIKKEREELEKEKENFKKEKSEFEAEKKKFLEESQESAKS